MTWIGQWIWFSVQQLYPTVVSISCIHQLYPTVVSIRRESCTGGSIAFVGPFAGHLSCHGLTIHWPTRHHSCIYTVYVFELNGMAAGLRRPGLPIQCVFCFLFRVFERTCYQQVVRKAGLGYGVVNKS